MATIVTHTESGRNYVLIGSGYGLWASSVPGFLGMQNREQGEHALLFVADDHGRVTALKPEEALVVSVDGQPTAHWLSAPRPGPVPGE